MFEDIPPRESGSGRVHVVIDTPAGSRNKYKYDEQFGIFRISRVLPQGAVFPYDFGFIPGTRAEDGDALDVLVLQLPASFPGCLVPARLIGVLHAEQRDGAQLIRNDRLIGVVDTPVNPARLQELSALDGEELRAIEHFFKSYNAFQGREFSIRSRGAPEDAIQALERAIEAHAAHSERKPR
ncbi:MAG TPA: inorganic diphosphatase [Steroidobacteraceae bacterium]|jgi:inorganic pyrophosphatase|nr:inorganic diphosphatase [Steroidobacteraceae bacterium]